MSERDKLRPVKLWALAGTANITSMMSYTRRDLIDAVLRQYGNKFTWPQLRAKGYRAVRVLVSPLPTPKENERG